MYFLDMFAPTLQLDHFSKGKDFVSSITTFSIHSIKAVPLHKHEFWETFFVLSGSGWHEVNGQKYPLEPGMLLLIRPRDAHAIHTDDTASLCFVNLAFRTSVWTSFLELAQLEARLQGWQNAQLPPLIRLTGKDSVQAESLFRASIHESLNAGSRVFLMNIWSYLIDWFLRPPDTRKPHAPPWLGQMIVSLEDQEALRLGLPAQLEQLGLSASHVSRTFKSFVGQSPVEYITQKRLERALLLLTQSEEKILDVAFECGFENLSYFYRCFKSFYKCSPKTYRSQVQRTIGP